MKNEFKAVKCGDYFADCVKFADGEEITRGSVVKDAFKLSMWYARSFYSEENALVVASTDKKYYEMLLSAEANGDYLEAERVRSMVWQYKGKLRFELVSIEEQEPWVSEHLEHWFTSMCELFAYGEATIY